MGLRHSNAPHCPRLTVLILSGGTSHTDMLVKKIDELCHQLSQHAPELQRLHLPVHWVVPDGDDVLSRLEQIFGKVSRLIFFGHLVCTTFEVTREQYF